MIVVFRTQPARFYGVCAISTLPLPPCSWPRHCAQCIAPLDSTTDLYLVARGFPGIFSFHDTQKEKSTHALVKCACSLHTYSRCEYSMPILSWANLRGFLFTGILISATSTIFRAFLYPVQLYPVTSSSQHYTQDLRDFDSAESDTQAKHENFNESAQKINRWQEFGLGTAAGRILGLPSAENTTFASNFFSARTWSRNKKANGNNNVRNVTLA